MSGKDAEYEDRIESEAALSFHITDDMLVCKDCVFKDLKGRSGVCEIYQDMKPVRVLNGGDCVAKTTV